MTADLRNSRTIHVEIPDDAPADEAEAFEDALADFAMAPSDRRWDPFMHSHTDACEDSDHCYGPGSRGEARIEAETLRALIRHCFDEHDALVAVGGIRTVERYVRDRLARIEAVR